MSVLKAYSGSCHCGDIQYQLKLKFPPGMKAGPSNDTIRIYKCNCTVCQKMGFFHCRPISPADDFILLSDPAELGEYRTSTKKTAWCFCKTCGCRVVGVVAEWDHIELDVAHWAGTKKQGDKDSMQKAWRTKGTLITTEVDGKEVSKPNHYISVNAVTLEPSEDVDLRKWQQNGWVFYVENRLKKNGTQMRLADPCEGGMY